MGEPKPLASLSSSLLARKGHARPAMRPQGFASFGFAGLQQSQDDLGWNDMGLDRGPADVEPISADVYKLVGNSPVEVPAVVRQQEDLARKLAAEPAEVPAFESAFTPVVAPPFTPRAAAGSKGKAAFTLRLDPDRHLQLRLACAIAHKSAQALVLSALDAFLAQQPGVAGMARRVTPATVTK